MATRSAIRVLLVDDHPIVLQSLRSALKAYPNLDIVGQARDAYEVMSSVDTLRPAVVVIDIDMKRMDGIGATQRIKKQYPGIAVVGLSLVPQDDQRYAMQQAGALEVIPKERAAAELYDAIQRALEFVPEALIGKEPAISEQTSEDCEPSANELMKKTDELIRLLSANGCGLSETKPPLRTKP